MAPGSKCAVRSASRRAAPFLVALALGLASVHAGAAPPEKGPEIRISRAAGPIAVDGDLSEPGWSGAARVETFFETSPGDNAPPKVRTIARLAQDDRFLYVAFECFDPDPARIRAPFGDHDSVSSSQDFAGIVVDTRGDGKVATEFFANPSGIQSDLVQDDASGNEDGSPDFYWDSAGRITAEGWTLEMRIPFSSLRYAGSDPKEWGIILYRNYPRDRRYQIFSARLPRGSNCFICHFSPLTGLSGLPSGGHWVAAPYVSAKEEGVPRGDPGSQLVNRPIEGTAGLDAKWLPGAATSLDLTINPDFSQVESDVAQISANERFALFYPEKRPFFLEGSELLTTPIQAVYTRTITSPRWGLRATGKAGGTSYTALVVEDRGGGSVVLPGPLDSALAPQDFGSFVGIGRVRHDLGRSFVSALVTDREVRGGGYNRVLGPDFQWRPNDTDSVTGQLLCSATQNPDRPDLSPSWDGRTFSGHAADVSWSHQTKTWDWSAEYKDFSDGFRADDGFVPQVGFREGFAEGGYTIRPTGFFSRVRFWTFSDVQADRDGATIFRRVSPGLGFDGPLSLFARVSAALDQVRTPDGVLLDRTYGTLTAQASPSRVFASISLDGHWGEEIDFAGSRKGHGGRTILQATIRPEDHLDLRFSGDLSWLDVPPFGGGAESRLYTAYVAWGKATWTFSSRSYVRLIAQYAGVRRNPELWATPVPAEDGAFSGSLLFAYKLNWQSVVFVGYGEGRTLVDGRLEPDGRQLFVKLSYAFQR